MPYLSGFELYSLWVALNFNIWLIILFIKYSISNIILRIEMSIVNLKIIFVKKQKQTCERPTQGRGEYSLLLYTKTVDSVFRALWLATQSVNIPHYSLIHLQFLGASDAKLV